MTIINRDIFFSENNSRVNNSSNTTNVSSVSLTFTPKVNTAYVVFWRTAVTSNNLNSLVNGRCLDEYDGQEFGSFEVSKQINTLDVDDFVSGFGFINANSSPVSHTINLTFCAGNSSFGSLGTLRNSGILAMELSNLDFYGSNSSFASSATITFQSLVNVTINNATTANYIGFICGKSGANNGTLDLVYRATEGSNIHLTASPGISSITPVHQMHQTFMFYHPSISGSRTYTFQFASTSASQTKFTTLNKLLLLNADEFYSPASVNVYTNDFYTNSITDWANVATVQYNTANGKYLVIGGMATQFGAGSRQLQYSLREDNNNRIFFFNDQTGSSNGSKKGTLGFYVANIQPGTINFNWSTRSNTGNIGMSNVVVSVMKISQYDPDFILTSQPHIITFGF